MGIIISLFIYSLILFERIAAFQDFVCSVENKEAAFDNWKPCKKVERCKCLEIQNEQVLVSCFNVMLRHVPTLLPTQTISLDLSYNLIETIGQKNFSRYKHLLTLNLAHNKLTTIQHGAFDGLLKLECLSLMSNSIRYNEEGFINGSFRHLKSVRKLNIQQHLTDFENEDYSFQAFVDLQQLETLYLDGIPNQTLEIVFQNMKQLKTLTFNGKTGRCHLAHLTREFFPRNTPLTNVTINHCDLKTIQPKTFESLTNLRYLDLSYNVKLTFSSLTNITNGLDKTNIEIIKLNNIHKTTGSCGRITVEQSLGFKNLALKEIYFDSNRLTSLEKGAVYNLPTSLKTISLREAILCLIESENIENIILADQFKSRYLYIPMDPSKLKAINTHAFEQNIVQTGKKIGGEDNNTMKTTMTFDAKYSDFQPKFSKQSGRKTITREFTTQYDLGSDFSDRIKRHLTKYKTVSLNVNKMKRIHKMDIICSLQTPLSLRYVDASNMKIRIALPPCNFSTPNNLQRLNLSINMYFEWNGPLQGFENLTILDLSWNSCARMDSDIFKSMASLEYLNLSRNFLDSSLSTDTTGEIFEHQHDLKDLDLSQNNLITLPEAIFKGLESLEVLNLSGNRLKKIRVELSHMTKLWKLDFSDNKLGTIEKSLRDYLDRQGKMHMNLEKNPLKCDCGHMEFVKWMSDTKVSFVHRDLYACEFGDDLRNLSSVEVGKLYNELQKKCFNYTPLIVVGTATLSLILAIIGGTLTYHYRWNLRYMYYFAKYKARGNKDRRAGYEPIAANENELTDVNVSYADEDSQFVVQKIHTELEENRGLKLYIRDRNAAAGEYICDNIFGAIENTKKTLIIMSEAYLRHKWCVFEMNMVGIKALKSDSDLVCVLMLEDVPHRKLPLKILRIIKDHEFLEYPGDRNLQDCFWERLKDLCTA